MAQLVTESNSSYIRVPYVGCVRSVRLPDIMIPKMLAHGTFKDKSYLFIYDGSDIFYTHDLAGNISFSTPRFTPVNRIEQMRFEDEILYMLTSDDEIWTFDVNSREYSMLMGNIVSMSHYGNVAFIDSGMWYRDAHGFKCNVSEVARGRQMFSVVNGTLVLVSRDCIRLVRFNRTHGDVRMNLVYDLQVHVIIVKKDH